MQEKEEPHCRIGQTDRPAPLLNGWSSLCKEAVYASRDFKQNQQFLGRHCQCYAESLGGHCQSDCCLLPTSNKKDHQQTNRHRKTNKYKNKKENKNRKLNCPFFGWSLLFRILGWSFCLPPTNMQIEE